MLRLRVSAMVVALVTVLVIATDSTGQVKVDELSLMTTPVLLLDGAKQVSLGTGFFFAKTDDAGKPTVAFLVTNYHVLTGYAPGQKGPKKGDRIRYFLHTDPVKPESVKTVEFPLYTTGGSPTWITNPSEPSADIALIPIPSSAAQGTHVIVFGEKDTKSEIRIAPMSPVTLVGYPYGYFDTKNFLPIWKTGSIASEPGYDFQGKRLFVVDVSAFPGMSGSPVLAIGMGSYPGKNGGLVAGDARQLLGVFASIETLQEKKFVEEIAVEQAKKMGVITATSLELGHVWKADIILEIVRAFDASSYESRITKNLPSR